MKAMILAAGRGERMGVLTQTTPKPLLSLGDESLVERHLRALAAAGIEQIVINVSWLGEQVRTALGDGQRYGVEILWSDEGATRLETAGGIVRALPLLGDAPFLVISSDVVADVDYAALMRAYVAAGESLDGMLVMVPSPPHHTQGDFAVDAQGMLALHGEALTYSGISVLSPALFEGVEDGPLKLRVVFDAAIAARRLGAMRHDGLWIDVGTPQRLEAARAAVAHN